MAVSTTLLGISYFADNHRLEFHAKPYGVRAKLWRDTVKVGTYLLENIPNIAAMTYETLPLNALSQVFRFLTLHHVQIRRDGVAFTVKRVPSPIGSPILSPIESPPPFEDPPHDAGISAEELNEELEIIRSLQLGPIPPEGAQTQGPRILSDEIIAQITECMLNPPIRLETFAAEADIDDLALFFPHPAPSELLLDNNKIVPLITLKGPYDGRLPRLITNQNRWTVSFCSRNNQCVYDFEEAFADTQPYLSAAVLASHMIMGSNERIAITADVSGSLKIWDVNQVDRCEIEIPNVFFCHCRVDDDGNQYVNELICDDEIVIGVEKIAALKPNGELFIWDLPTRALSLHLSEEQVFQYQLAFRDIDGDDTPFTNFSFHDDRILIQSFERQERTGRFVLQLFYLELNPISMRQHLLAPEELFVGMHQGRVVTIFDQRRLYFSELCSNAPRTFVMNLGFDVKKIYRCGNEIVFVSTVNTIHIVDLIQRRKMDLVMPELDINYDLISEVKMIGGKLIFLESRVVKFNIYILELIPPTTDAAANVSSPGSSISSTLTLGE
jgi:hypothetical protein